MALTIRKLKRFLLVLLVLLTLAPGPAFAADLRQGSTVTIGPSETLKDDLYAAASTIDVSGTVDGSVIASGGNITVSGTITRDLIVAGGTVTVAGNVRGSIRAFMGTLVLNGNVGEDLVVLGGTIDIGRSAKVGRDLVVAGGTATLGGSIGRKVLASVDALTIRGPVGGDVQATANTLRLEDGAAVTGNLVYSSDNQAFIAPGAKVEGKVTRNPLDGRLQRRAGPAERLGDALVGWIRAMVGLFALGLVLLLLFPGFSTSTVKTFTSSPWINLGVGFALLIGIPFVALIGFVVGLFVGGWWLALIAVGLYVVALAVAYVLAALFVGQRGLDLAGRRGVHPLLALLAGLVVLTLVGLIPILGGLITLAACVFGLGGLAITLAKARQTATG
jgi:cytoskeletal protein CcmA (bactofilin family)